jgi:hypothetical protein
MRRNIWVPIVVGVSHLIHVPQYLADIVAAHRHFVSPSCVRGVIITDE